MTRIQNFQKIIFQKTFRPQINGVLISDMTNIGYLTGFWGTYGRLIVTRKKVVLISDGRYAEVAKKVIQKISPSPSLAKRGRKDPSPFDKGGKMGISFVVLGQSKDFWKKLCVHLKIASLGFEAEHISVAHLKKMKKAFGRGVSLRPMENIVEKLRLQKELGEIRSLEKSAKINDRAFKKILPYLKTGVTEKEIAWIFERIAREKLGAEGLSFPPIIAFGKNSAIPHHHSGAMKLKKNMPVLIDAGVTYKKYCSDMTRCFFYGSPNAEWQNAFDLVQKAQQKGIELAISGNTCAKIDSEVRKIFGKQEKYFIHSLGHGVGLQIHESPSLSQKSKEVLKENMVITVEPGLYFPEKFGIRIEDVVLVQKKKNKILSRFPCEYKI